MKRYIKRVEQSGAHDVALSFRKVVTSGLTDPRVPPAAPVSMRLATHRTTTWWSAAVSRLPTVSPWIGSTVTSTGRTASWRRSRWRRQTAARERRWSRSTWRSPEPSWWIPPKSKREMTRRQMFSVLPPTQTSSLSCPLLQLYVLDRLGPEG